MPLAGTIIVGVGEVVEEIKRGYVLERDRNATANVWNVPTGLSVL